MRLSLVLPNIEQQKPTAPTHCPYEDCQSTQLRLHQEVIKPLRDTRYQQVTAYRYQCLKCKRTFRVYPSGVNSAPTSQRVKDLGVVLYLLGLSYRSVSQALEALGVYLCASCVYSAVQATLKQRAGLSRQHILDAVKAATNGTSATQVMYRGKWIPLRLSIDDIDTHNVTLSLEELTEDEAQELALLTALLAETRIDKDDGLLDANKSDTPKGKEEEQDSINKQGSTSIAMTPVLVGS